MTVETKKILRSLVLIIILVVGLWIGLNYSNEKRVACTTDAMLCPDGSAVGRTSPDCTFPECPQLKVKLYYYNSENDKDETGNIKCSRDGLVSVERTITKTKTPIQDTIKLLLEGKINEEEKATGIKTEFPLDGVTLKGATLKNSVLKLEINDPNSRTSGGSCRAGILWYQIEATAKQFPEVISVKFTPEDLFQP